MRERMLRASAQTSFLDSKKLPPADDVGSDFHESFVDGGTTFGSKAQAPGAR
jgi:hypothetical protein